MAVSPEVMQANGGGPAAPPPGSPPPPDAAPGAAPMMSPQVPAGQQESAKVDCHMAQKMLEKALAAFGSSSEEGKAVLKAIGALAKAFGKDEEKTDELMPAEIKQMLQSLAGPGAPPKSAPPPGAGAPPPGGAPPPPGA